MATEFTSILVSGVSSPNGDSTRTTGLVTSGVSGPDDASRFRSILVSGVGAEDEPSNIGFVSILTSGVSNPSNDSFSTHGFLVSGVSSVDEPFDPTAQPRYCDPVEESGFMRDYSLNGVNLYGLASLAWSWTPLALRTTEEEVRAMRAFNDALADVLNPLIEFERYMPLILNPARTLDEDLFRILDLNGIDLRNQTISPVKLRRLALLAAELRAWRGSFSSHQSLASAMTGGPVIMDTWLSQRWILDEADWGTLVLLDNPNETLIYVLGQGPSSDFIEGELTDLIDRFAKPALDSVVVIPCFALTAWRNGLEEWNVSGTPEVIPTAVEGENQAVELGPGVEATANQFLRSTTEKDAVSLDESIWQRVIFRTNGAADGDFWEFMAYATFDANDPSSGDAYLIRVNVGYGNLTVHRKVAGVVGAAILTWPVEIFDGGVDVDAYHRIDFYVRQTSTKVRFKVVVDGNPTGWYDDVVVPGPSRPSGTYMFVGLNTSDFTQGRLRVSLITGRLQDGA